jgi:hypothetical protein
MTEFSIVLGLSAEACAIFVVIKKAQVRMFTMTFLKRGAWASVLLKQ